jgi:hypothetical protein
VWISTYTSTNDPIFYIRQTSAKNREYNCRLHQVFIDLKKAYDSVRREVLYNISVEFVITRKLGGLIKRCLNKDHSTVRTDKKLLDNFHIRNGLKRGEAL